MIPDATITGTLNSFVKTRKTPADSHTSKGAFALTSSTKKVNPLKLSLKLCFFTVGKKELYLSLLNNDRDLFNAKGVRKEEKIK